MPLYIFLPKCTGCQILSVNQHHVLKTAVCNTATVSQSLGLIKEDFDIVVSAFFSHSTYEVGR